MSSFIPRIHTDHSHVSCLHPYLVYRYLFAVFARPTHSTIMIEWRGGPDPPLALPLPPCNFEILHCCFCCWHSFTTYGFIRLMSLALMFCIVSLLMPFIHFAKTVSSHSSASASFPGRIVLTSPAFILFIVSYLTSFHQHPFLTHGHARERTKSAPSFDS